MPRIVLTDKADSDLEAIHAHYASRIGAVGADQIIHCLIESLEKLELFTGMGRPSQVPGVRELIMTHVPFLAAYRVMQDEIQVLRVVHQRAARTEDW